MSLRSGCDKEAQTRYARKRAEHRERSKSATIKRLRYREQKLALHRAQMESLRRIMFFGDEGREYQ